MLGFDPEVYFKKPKAVCVLTNTINQNFTSSNSLYEDSKYKKIVMT